MANGQQAGEHDWLFDEFGGGRLGATPPKAPTDLPGVPEPADAPLRAIAKKKPRKASEHDWLFEEFGGGDGREAEAAIPPGYDEPPKPIVPREVRRASPSKISSMQEEEALQYLPDTLDEKPTPELLEDVDWQRDPEAFELAHRKMVRDYGRARSKSDKAEIMRDFTAEWNPELLQRAEEESGVFMGTLTGLAAVIEWVDSWSGRPIRATYKSLWGSRKRDLEGGGDYNLEEFEGAIADNYKTSDGSFDDGEDTLKSVIKYVTAATGTPLGWLHAEASGQDFTEENWLSSVDENIDKMFDYGADAIQWATWTGLGVLDQALPFVGDNYKGWAESRDKKIEEGSSFGHGALGFVGLIFSDPLSFLKLPRAFQIAGAKVTDSAKNVIDDAIHYETAAQARLIRKAAEKTGKFKDEAGVLDEDRILQEAKDIATARTNLAVVDAADVGFRHGVDVHGWQSVELLRQWREGIEHTSPAYWKAKFPSMADDVVDEMAGEFAMDKESAAVVSNVLKQLGVDLPTNATPTVRVEEAWAALNKEANRRKRLFDIEVKLTGEVDPDTGEEIVKSIIHWVDPRRSLDVNGNMMFRLTKAEDVKPHLATKVGGAVGKAIGEALPKTKAAADAAYGRAIDEAFPGTKVAADDAARAAADVAYGRAKIYAKSDNRRVRWGMAAMKSFPGLEGFRLTAESIIALEKAQPYFKKVGDHYQPMKVHHQAMWRMFERGELQDQARRTLDKQRLANHIAKIESLTDTTTPEGQDVLKLAVVYKELGKHIPATEAQIEAFAWMTKVKQGLQNIEDGITDDLPIEAVRPLLQSLKEGKASDLMGSLERDLRRIHEAIGPERKELIKAFKLHLNETSSVLKKVLTDDFRVQAEFQTMKDVAGKVEHAKHLRHMKSELEKLATEKGFSDEDGLEALLEQLRAISKMQDEGIDAIREEVPDMARTEAEFLQKMRTRGLIPEGSWTDWSAHKGNLHGRVRNALRATGVDEWEAQADGVMATMSARAQAWASWNGLPADYADSWFTKYSKDIEEEVLGRAVEIAPISSAAKRIEETLEGVEGKRVLEEMRKSAVTPEMGEAYARLAASRANAWAVANDRPAEEFLARLHIRTAKDTDEVFGKLIYEIDPDLKPVEIIGGTGKLSDPAKEGGLPWQWQVATPNELDDFMDLLGGKYREDYVKKVAASKRSKDYERKFAAYEELEKSDKAYNAAWDAYYKQKEAFDDKVALGVPWSPERVRAAAKSGSKLLDMSGAHAYNKTVDRWQDMLRFYVRTESDGTLRLALAPRKYANLDADELIAGSKEWIAKAELHTFKDPVGKTKAWRREEEKAIALYKEKKRLHEAWGRERVRIYNSIFRPEKLETTNGFIVFGEQEKAAIFLLESARPGTLGHELGHFFRRDLPQELQDRAAAWAERASGIGKVGDKWSIGMEEAFAEAFELYLKTGVAPAASGMAGIFAKFKEWIKQIMTPLIQSGKLKRVDDEIRQVFDEMFDSGAVRGGSGDAGAAAARESREIVSAFQSQTFQGMIKGAGRVFAKDLPSKDYDIASDWIRRELGDAGFRKNGDWSEAGLSAWGQAFANWTKSGRVSNHGLREVFAKFKDWIFKMYRAVSGQKEYKFKISPEVEDIFDRILTKDGYYQVHPMALDFDVAYQNYIKSYGGNISVLGKAILNESLESMMKAAKYSPDKIRWVHDKLFSGDKMESIEALKFIKEEVSDRLAARFNPPKEGFSIKAPGFKNNKTSFKSAVADALQEHAGMTGEEAREVLSLAEYDDIVKSAIPQGRFTYDKGRTNFQNIVLAFAKRFVALNPDKAPAYPRMGYKIPGRADVDAVNNLEKTRAAWKGRKPSKSLGGGLDFDYEKTQVRYYKAALQVLKMAGRPDAEALAGRIIGSNVKHSEMLELDDALKSASERLKTPRSERRAEVEKKIRIYDTAIGELKNQLKGAEEELAGIRAGKPAVAEEVVEEAEAEFKRWFGDSDVAEEAVGRAPIKPLKRDEHRIPVTQDEWNKLPKEERFAKVSNVYVEAEGGLVKLTRPQLEKVAEGEDWIDVGRMLVKTAKVSDNKWKNLPAGVYADESGRLGSEKVGVEVVGMDDFDIGVAKAFLKNHLYRRPTHAAPKPSREAPDLVKKGAVYYPRTETGMIDESVAPIHKASIGGEDRYLTWIEIEGLGKNWLEYGEELPEFGTGVYTKKELVAKLEKEAASAPKPAAAPKPVDIPDDISRQAARYQQTRNIDPHDDLVSDFAYLSPDKPAIVVKRIKRVVEDKLKRDHGISEGAAKRLIKDEGSDWSASSRGDKASSVARNVLRDPVKWISERVEELRRAARPDDYLFNVKAVEDFIQGRGGVLPDVANAAVKARGLIDETGEKIRDLQEKRAALVEELNALDITPEQASIAEAGEVSAKRNPVSEEARDRAKAKTSWLEEEIAKLDAEIQEEFRAARSSADNMAQAAFEKEMEPLARYEITEKGRKRRVLVGRGEEQVSGAIEDIERRIAEGLTRGQPGKRKGPMDMPSIVPKRLTESMKKKIEALPGAKEEMLDIARKLKWDTTNPGEIWENIVNYKKYARSYGDAAEANRELARQAIYDWERLREYSRLPEAEKTVIINLLKDPRKYSIPPGASKKVREMGESLGMSSRGREDVFIHLSGKHITKRYGLGPDAGKVKRVRAGDHFTDEEMEQALAIAKVMEEFLEEKLVKLQRHGRLAQFRDKAVGAQIDLIRRKIAGKEELAEGETREGLEEALEGLREKEFRAWTKEEFLRRVNVASYIPHMMRIAARRKIDGMKGKNLLPANYVTGFERMRTRASILDDINEQARNELAEDMLYHDVTSLMSNGPRFQSVFEGRSPEELAAIYDAANSLKLREHFAPEEWDALLKRKRAQADLDGVYEFFETDYFTLIKRYSESIDRSIADQVFIEDILEMFPIGKEMGRDSRFVNNPDLAREFGYVRLGKRDQVEAIGRMKLPDEMTGDIEVFVNQQLQDGATIPEVMAALRRKGVNVSRNVVELYGRMPEVFVPEPVAEYLKWMRTPEVHKGAWGAAVQLADGLHALAKTMTTVASLAHIGMNFSGNYASIAQKVGTDLFNPRHHMNMWTVMLSDTFPELEKKMITVGARRQTVGELKREMAINGIDESPRSLAFLEEALGRTEGSAAKTPLAPMLLGSGMGATGGWIAGSAIAGPLGGAAGGFLGSWAGALGGEILGKSWRAGIDPKTGRAVTGPISSGELDVGRGVRSYAKTEVGKFVEAIADAKKGRLKEGVQRVGELAVGSGTSAVIGSAMGGPAAAVAMAIGGLTFPSYIRMMSALNQSVEIQARRLLALAEMSRGKSMDEVAFSVQDTMRNYSHLTPFERNKLRRLFFFYTWDAGNVRFQLRQMVDNPRQAVIFQQFMNGVYNGQFTESEIQSLPEYLRWKAVVRVGGAKIYGFSGLPQQAAIELSRGFGTHGGKPIGLFSRGRPDAMLLVEWLMGKESLYYGKGWNELTNVRQMKNAPPALKAWVGYPSRPVRVPVYKNGRVVGTREDFRANNPDRFYIASRLPGWRVMMEYMKLVQDTFISRALDYGDPSAKATMEERMLAFSVGTKPYFVDFESQKEYMAHMLDRALQEEWDRINKNFMIQQNFLNRNWDYRRGHLLYPGDTVDSEPADQYSQDTEAE